MFFPEDIVIVFYTGARVSNLPFIVSPLTSCRPITICVLFVRCWAQWYNDDHNIHSYDQKIGRQGDDMK